MTAGQRWRTAPRNVVSGTAATDHAARHGAWLAALVAAIWVSSVVIGFQPALTVLTVLGFAGAIVGVYRPEIGLFALGMLCTLDAADRNFLFLGGLWRWNTFNYGLLAVLLVFSPLIVRRRGVQIGWFYGLVVVLAIGLVISADVPEGVQHIFSVVALLGLLVYFARARLDAASLYGLALVCGVTAVGGSVAFLFQQGRLPYFNPNSFTFLPLTALFAICLAFPFLSATPQRQTRLALLAAANLMAVFLSGSRGGLLLGVVCAMSLLVELRGVRRRLVVVAAAGLVAFAASVQFTDLQANAVHRISKLVDSRYSLAERTSGRVDLLVGGWYVFAAHPFFGTGTGGFADAWMHLPDQDRTFRFHDQAKQAHAGWVKTLAENGIVGFAMLLGFVSSFAVVGWRTRRRELRWLGLLTAAVLGFAFVSTEFQMKGLWFLAAGTMQLLTPPRPRA